MSGAASILDALITQLKNSSHLSDIQDSFILLGAREGINNFPAIIVEPVSIAEVEYVYPKQRLTLLAAIIAYVQVQDKDKQIVGDANTKGILDIENDIKLAIDDDRTIGGYAIHARPVSSEYSFIDYPVRSVTITVTILFEQTTGTRT